MVTKWNEVTIIFQLVCKEKLYMDNISNKFKTELEKTDAIRKYAIWSKLRYLVNTKTSKSNLSSDVADAIEDEEL